MATDPSKSPVAASDHIATVPTQPEIAAQVSRILESALFQNSEWSRKLLAFLAERTLQNGNQPAKESEVAVLVFNRAPASFDAQSDSIVRVHIARLRAKLLEYYAGQGSGDGVGIEVPKGSYCIVATYRPKRDDSPAGATAVDGEPAAALQEATAPGRRRIVMLSAAAVLVVVAVLLVYAVRQWARPSRLQQFWAAVLNDNAPNLVIFSNPRLAGTLSNDGLRYYREEIDGKVPGAENLSYTGAGDLMAVHALTKMFDHLDRRVEVRSGALLEWAEAKDSNLIFVGRPEQNPALHSLPRLREFYFKYDTGLVNAHPRPGESEVYRCSNRRPYTEDHAVIAFTPGLSPGRSTLIFAGNTTHGSQAAAEFVARDAGVAALLDELGVKPGAKIPYFEVVLRVRITHETPVWSRIVAKRQLAPDRGSWEAALPDER